MKIDARLDATDIPTVREVARRAESTGYSALWTSETSHDPFLPLVVAAEHTERISLGCAVAVAFARNPMTVANVTHDLQRYSGGRFTLGLGTQIKSHIERRFSMPWLDPAARLAEFISAVRAILVSFESAEPLAFEGRYYRHTLLTPMFRPQPHGHGQPRIIMGGVGRGMIETAGQAADGLLVHAFSTPSYLRAGVLPAVARGLSGRGLQRSDFEVSCRGFLATGRNDAELEAAKESVRGRIAFYGSTPAYRPVLEHHGWGALGDELRELSRSDDPARWSTMSRLVSDEVLETFAVVAKPEHAGAEITRRYADVADRFWFYTPYELAPEVLDEITQSLLPPPAV